MNTTQIILVVAIIFVSFIIGRASKKVTLPLIGSIDVRERDDDGNVSPRLKFGINKVEDLEKYNYIALKIVKESRQNQQL